MGATQVLTAQEAQEAKFHTLGGLARRWRLCYMTVYRKARSGKLRTVRLGGSIRVPVGEVARVEANGF
jgi:hypothetical protein